MLRDSEKERKRNRQRQREYEIKYEGDKIKIETEWIRERIFGRLSAWEGENEREWERQGQTENEKDIKR